MKKKEEITVGGLAFEWDIEKGKFLFEGQESVLFWISSAMKLLFDSIEEIAGVETTDIVMESTGFRQGLIVGDYFQNDKNVNVEEAVQRITNTYASAGWGLAKVQEMNLEEQTLFIHLIDSWEHKINVEQGKQTGGRYLPAHYAGIFTRLFGRGIWYEVEHYQIEGNAETRVRYFPSEETIERNISRLERQKEAEQFLKQEQIVEQKTAELKAMIRDISSPIIPVLEDIVVVPLLGSYDEMRAEELLTKTLQNLPKHKARYLVLDLTGLDDNFNQQSASLIDKLGATAALIGTQTILVGISPAMSMTITESGIDMRQFQFFQSLEHGIHYALAQNGRMIVDSAE